LVKAKIYLNKTKRTEMQSAAMKIARNSLLAFYVPCACVYVCL